MKKETVPRQQSQSPSDSDGKLTTKPAESILPHLPADVKTLRAFYEDRHIPIADQVEVVKTLYPRYDRYTHSKCCHGEECGVMLRPDALSALVVHFAEDGKAAPRKPRRAKPNRLTCRVSDSAYRALQRRLSETGQTTQDYIEALILKDLTGGNTSEQVP